MDVLCVVLVLGLATAVCSTDMDKRLLLQSSTDIVQEILTLKAQVATMETELTKLHFAVADRDNKITQLQSTVNTLSTQQGGGGSAYTRWGRTSCPGNGTSLVYSGYMAGTYYDGPNGDGSGANYLCLADQPTWDHYRTDVNNVIRVTGVQYQFWIHASTAHDLPDFFGSDIFKNEAPCAVCHSSRATSVMIPGRKDCYPGWTKEYSGYLVGGYVPFADSSEYVCLDRRPESVVNSGANDLENQLFFVEAECGKALACPPYVHDRELSCVVCTA